MTPRLALLAAPLAAGAALIPASVARADNADVIRHTEVLVTAVNTGHTAGHVTACLNANGHPFRIVSFRVHDWSRGVYTRMGGGGRVIHVRYCARTGNWFRVMRSDVTASVVDQVTGAYGTIVMPVA